ncbi:carboxypeptidase [Ornithinibacillus sp. L9]|uniref:Carboxypeptidase n=1 Tax=Ornithinibacillus caprae TaxID=2678566 RepID=A0A6N8FJK5_9BACI|nr:D-alanyl-D-alanine carboxypeptidase family protein [Ornithinibacillus caprae]MUK89832.1 carboxypeptidase [Ornithinibacillus caprae]
MVKSNLIISLTILTLIFLLSGCNFSKQQPEESPPPDSSEEHESEVDDEQSEEITGESNEKEEFITLPEEGLQKGDEGEAVRILQEFLNELGYSIAITEQFDQETIWALTDFQLQQDDNMEVTGLYDQQTKDSLELVTVGDIEIKPGSALSYEKNASLDEETVELANPYEILALVNKKHALPADYIPDDLVVPDVRFTFVEDNPKKQMRKIAANALEELFAAIDEEDLDLFAQSGYRSYETQDNLYTSYVTTYGEEEANMFSAKPGESEHQSGLSMDVTSPDVDYRLITDFGDTEEGKWLQQNAADYGFIIRYPLGKEEITEYQYEPWHLRYVGIQAAKEIMEQGITLEEYLGEN